MARFNHAGRGEIDAPTVTGDAYAGTPAVVFGTTYVAGSGTTLLRTDDQILFPTAVMSSANLSTITLTDDAVDQTLAGSLGVFRITAASDSMALPSRIVLGIPGANPATDSAAFFVTRTSLTGVFMRAGLEGGVTADDASAHTSESFYGGLLRVACSNVAGATYTAVTMRALELQITPTTHTTGTHSFTERTGLNISAAMALQSGSGAVSCTDVHGVRVSGFPVIGTIGTYTNARGVRIQMPTVGATIRRGFSLETGTQNVGTEAANVEGYYCEDLTRGTAQRVNYYAEGATTGTPTDVYGFFQGTAHAVGTNRYGIRTLNRNQFSNPSGQAETVLELRQLNTGATAGAHVNFDDKAGNPAAPVTGDLWRNGNALNFRQAAATVDLTNPSVTAATDWPVQFAMMGA